jgi:O-antigen/teichoic acid export membrane protein
MNRNNQLKYGAIMSYGVVIFNIIAGLIYTPWMINKIGSADYGLYVLVTTFLAYFISDYGMWQALNKLISQYIAENRVKEIKNILGIATKLYSFLSLFLSGVLMLIYFNIDSLFVELTVVELKKFKVIYLISVAFNFLLFPLSFLKGVMISYELIVQSRFFDLISKILLILVTVLLLYLNYGLYSLVIAYGLVPLIVNLIKVFFLYNKGVRINLKYWNWSIVKQIFGISIWLFFIVLAELIVNKSSPALLASLSGSEEIAIFAIGFSISNYVSSIAGSINGIFLPKLTRMHIKLDYQAISNFSLKVSRIQFFIIGYLIMGILLTGKTFIKAWIGESFINSYYVLIFLIIPGLIFFSQRVESSYMFVADKLKYRAIMMLIAAIFTIILSLLLIPIYGALGASLSIGISTLIFEVVGMNIIYKKMMNFNLKRFFKTFSIFALGYLFVVLFYFIIINALNEKLLKECNHWIQFIVSAIIYSIVYYTLIFFILNDYEKNLINSFLKKLKT